MTVVSLGRVEVLEGMLEELVEVVDVEDDVVELLLVVEDVEDDVLEVVEDVVLEVVEDVVDELVVELEVVVVVVAVTGGGRVGVASPSPPSLPVVPSPLVEPSPGPAAGTPVAVSPPSGLPGSAMVVVAGVFAVVIGMACLSS